MGAPKSAPIEAAWRRARRFVGEDVWHARLEVLPARTALLYQSVRVGSTALRGLLFEDALHVRAAALTYFTVLSLVPLLAFAFAVLKGFGAYDALISETIRPYVLDNLAANPDLQRAVEQLLSFVEHTGVASLGTLGLLTLLYAATRLLRNIEIALNEIWGAHNARNPVQQLRDYVAIIVVTPLCMTAAFALTTLGQLVETIRSMEQMLGLHGVVDWLLGALGPFAAIFLGLLFLYIVMPNIRVRPRSAVLGAVIGAVLWYAVLVAHVRFQVGVARFNALYAGFAVVPIFLAWLHLSWLVVLVGAETAAAHQNGEVHAARVRLGATDQALRERLCISAMLQIARAFTQGERLPTLADLSTGDAGGSAVLLPLLREQVRAGLLIASDAGKSATYALARAPERIRVKHILDPLRRTEASVAPAALPGLDPVADSAWHELDRACDEAAENRTLAELVHSEAQPSGIQRTRHSAAG